MVWCRGGGTMGQPFKKRMLLSDDIYRALEPIDCFIHRSGFQTRVGRTGDEIVDLARRDPPDVVMTNYYLAGYYLIGPKVSYW